MKSQALEVLRFHEDDIDEEEEDNKSFIVFSRNSVPSYNMTPRVLCSLLGSASVTTVIRDMGI